MLSAKGLKKIYGDFAAVDGIDFDVRRGESFGILGPNGAGKSTTMKMITGFLEPDSGSASIFGAHGPTASPLSFSTRTRP